MRRASAAQRPGPTPRSHCPTCDTALVSHRIGLDGESVLLCRSCLYPIESDLDVHAFLETAPPPGPLESGAPLSAKRRASVTHGTEPDPRRDSRGDSDGSGSGSSSSDESIFSSKRSDTTGSQRRQGTGARATKGVLHSTVLQSPHGWSPLRFWDTAHETKVVLWTPILLRPESRPPVCFVWLDAALTLLCTTLSLRAILKRVVDECDYIPPVELLVCSPFDLTVCESQARFEEHLQLLPKCLQPHAASRTLFPRASNMDALFAAFHHFDRAQELFHAASDVASPLAAPPWRTHLETARTFVFAYLFLRTNCSVDKAWALGEVLAVLLGPDEAKPPAPAAPSGLFLGSTTHDLLLHSICSECSFQTSSDKVERHVPVIHIPDVSHFLSSETLPSSQLQRQREERERWRKRRQILAAGNYRSVKAAVPTKQNPWKRDASQPIFHVNSGTPGESPLSRILLRTAHSDRASGAAQPNQAGASAPSLAAGRLPAADPSLLPPEMTLMEKMLAASDADTEGDAGYFSMRRPSFFTTCETCRSASKSLETYADFVSTGSVLIGSFPSGVCFEPWDWDPQGELVLPALNLDDLPPVPRLSASFVSEKGDLFRVTHVVAERQASLDEIASKLHVGRPGSERLPSLILSALAPEPSIMETVERVTQSSAEPSAAATPESEPPSSDAALSVYENIAQYGDCWLRASSLGPLGPLEGCAWSKSASASVSRELDPRLVRLVVWERAEQIARPPSDARTSQSVAEEFRAEFGRAASEAVARMR